MRAGRIFLSFFFLSVSNPALADQTSHAANSRELTEAAPWIVQS